MKKKFISYLFLLCPFYMLAQAPMDSEIWLSDMRMKEGSIYFGPAKNITNTPGYDNQPCFLNDTTILYTHIGEDQQADIYQYHTGKKSVSKFTDTKISEYSPRLNPQKNGITTVVVEQDSAQRIWIYDLNGNNAKVLVPHIDSVGYYTWVNDSTFAAFILTQPFTLQWCSVKHKQTKIIAKNIGRCIQTGANGSVYFTELGEDSVRWLCQIAPEGKITRLIEFYKGVEDFVISNANVVFCAKGSILYFCDTNYKSGWRECGNLSAFGVTNINRIAISPDNKKMALVTVAETKK